MKGGETTFPRWVNAETFRELKVTPEVGQAVLFYSQLPDGNLDDFSQHAAQPVIEGEKVNENVIGVCFRLRQLLSDCLLTFFDFFTLLHHAFRILVGTLFHLAILYFVTCHIVFCDNFLTLTSLFAAHQPLGMGRRVPLNAL